MPTKTHDELIKEAARWAEALGFGVVECQEKKGDWFGDKIIPYYCRNCGYIELYKKRRNRP